MSDLVGRAGRPLGAGRPFGAGRPVLPRPGGHPAASGYQVQLTGTGSTIGFLGLAALAAAVAAAQLAIGLLAGVALALLAVSFFLRPSMAWGVSLTGPSRCVEGEPVEHVATVVNGGRAASPPVLLRVGLEGFTPVDLAVPALHAGELVEASVVLRPIRRGPVRRLQVTRVTDAPFGLVRRTVTTVDQVRGVVHPPHREAVPLLGGVPVGDLPVGAPDRGGAPFHAVREHRPGDGSRDVHWRSTAKRGQLVVMEREREESPEPLVVLVGPSAPVGLDRAWEQLVARLAWSLATAIQTGVRPQLVVLAAPGPPAKAGFASAVEALDAVSLVTSALAPTADQIDSIAAMAPRGTRVVVFAPSPAPPDPAQPQVPGAGGARYDLLFAAAGLPVTLVTS